MRYLQNSSVESDYWSVYIDVKYCGGSEKSFFCCCKKRPLYKFSLLQMTTGGKEDSVNIFILNGY